MGRFFVGIVLFRRARKMDRRPKSHFSDNPRGAMGFFYVCYRVVRAGAAVSVLAADLYATAVLLGRRSRTPLIGFNLSDVSLGTKQASALLRLWIASAITGIMVQ